MKYTVIDNYDRDNKLEFENFDDMLDYFEPSKEDFPEYFEKWEQVQDIFDLRGFLYEEEGDERFQIIELEQE